MKKDNKVLLCIGGNIGDREANMEEARMFISFNFGEILQQSSVKETAPWGMSVDTPYFLNQILLVETSLSPEQLYTEIEELETYFGRERGGVGYKNREMDVDVLSYNNEIMNTEQLQVPHPRLHERLFVLDLMKEVVPEFVHPVLNKTIDAMRADLL
jgi:2-amino-4-hydroxy-6-hydroxymethyldihydropteridine diphosphokinase